MRYFALAAGFAFVLAAIASGPVKAEGTLKMDGKCWMNTSNGNWEWAACKKEAHSKKSHHKD